MRKITKFFKSTGLIKPNFSLLFTLLYFAMSISQAASAGVNDEVRLTVMHLNDVYEITPVSGGTQGGLSRVATLKKQLKAENPNTIITLSGDIYGPSGLSNAAMIDGKPLAGEQVVAVLNKVGIDAFTFGDHEFDQFSAQQVLQRFQETKFPMISSNYADVDGKPFQQSSVSGATVDVMKNTVLTFSNPTGASVRVGLFGITEPFRKSDLKVTYTQWEEAAAEQIGLLKGGDNPVDIIIAMTHFGIGIDKEIATKFPQIDLILGGDDHEHMKVIAGANLAPIYKSDSNARNIYIVDLYYDTAADKLRIEDRVQNVSDAIADDPEVLAETNKWLEVAYNAFRQQGMQPERIINKSVPFVLDGFATSIRNKQTELTLLILNGINNSLNTDLSLFPSGMLRLDDAIPAGGVITEYDVVRAFPTNYEVVAVKMKGSIIQSMLDASVASKGSGTFMLLSGNVSRDAAGSWMIGGKTLDKDRVYSVGVMDASAQYFNFKGMLEAFDDGETIHKSGITLRQTLISQVSKL